MLKSSGKSSLSLPLWVVFLLFFATNGALLTAFYLTLSPVRDSDVKVHVPSGATLSGIAGILEDNRVIRSPLAFQLLTRIRGLESGLRAGDYVIPPGKSLWETISLMTTGRGDMARFTIPEGLTDKQVVERLSGALKGIDRDRMLALVEGDSLARAMGLEVPRLLGYLFPDTYFVPPSIGEEELVRLMVERFRSVFDELTSQGGTANGMSSHETVILASIIEKEAVLERERPIISSVFLNRLERKRPLESCATVLFVLGKHKSRLLYRDLEVKSPYNTYLHRGLPPGPICNPGRGSLKAALQPADTNYLYFVARGDGRHAFTRSLVDHNRAKRRFQSSGPGG
ncbi:MAG: endolytic transglycosylase MltG [Candidatus Glassbacteria bacterium]|nr:endolytic transglycosylase MltG [Candidatus Glassbacteria bacterium]